MQAIPSYFQEAPLLQSERLILRAFKARDAADCVEISVYDGVSATTEEEALLILQRIWADCLRGESVHWGICLKEDNKIIGNCGFYRGFKDNTGEIGYVLKTAHQGKGIMTEAICLVVFDFGFKAMQLDKIVAYTGPENIASQKVLEKVGFKELERTSSELKLELTK